MTFTLADGNAWFLRNKNTLLTRNPFVDDWPIRLLEMYRIVPKKVLEIGCSNGWRLAALQERYGCECLGFDLSIEALADGHCRYNTRIRLWKGSAENLPTEETFDLVVLSFVLHCLDRSVALRAVSEVDRVLQNRGLIVLQDFAPAYPQRTSWRNVPDTWTYKHPNYGQIFAALGTYVELARISFDHDNDCKLAVSVSDKQRAAAILLQKYEGYPEVSF